MRKILSALCIFTAIAMGMPLPASAEKPAWAGNGNSGKHGNPGAKGNKGNGGQHGAGRANRNSGRNWNNQAGNRYPGAGNYPAQNFSFDNRQRAIIHDYFAPRFQSGRCPPGLAKKYNGCLPPGQANKWAIGYPLPRNVVFYDLPPPLLGQLGYPRPGYRYVRVAADILLIAAGTGVVLAAIEDLNSM
jgi:Ni/Co efflux regulator RcnB